MALSTVLLLCTLVAVVCVKAELSISIERYFPCSLEKGPSQSNLRIKFPSYKTPGVRFNKEIDPQGRTCFLMSGGPVEVYPPGLDGQKRYYVHLEVRFGIHGKAERCVNADPSGCGGIGSCVYCDICSYTDSYYKNFVQIFRKGVPAKCDASGFPPGTYTDASLKMCLPNEQEFLPLLDKNIERAKQMMEFIVNTRGRAGKIPVVIAARLFDRPINNLPKSALNDLLFGSKSGMVGCHYIYATATRI